jgi:hypothetical protein
MSVNAHISHSNPKWCQIFSIKYKKAQLSCVFERKMVSDKFINHTNIAIINANPSFSSENILSKFCLDSKTETVCQKCSVHFVLKACSMNPFSDIIHFLHLLGHQNTAILKVLSTQTRDYSNEKKEMI